MLDVGTVAWSGIRDPRLWVSTNLQHSNLRSGRCALTVPQRLQVGWQVNVYLIQTSAASGFSFAVAVFSFTQPIAAKIEAQHRTSKTVQRFHGMKLHLVVHRAAVNRMRMTDQSRMTRVLCARVEQRFEASCGAIDEHRTN